MTTQVRVAGVLLDSRYLTADVQDSTIWRREGWSGDYQASCTWGAPVDFTAAWLHKGATYEHVEDGLTTWSGLVSEIEVGDTLAIHAYGYGSQADEARSVVTVSSDLVPTAIPDDALDYAIAEGDIAWVRDESIGIAAVSTSDDVLMDLTTLLNRQAQSVGKRWLVDTWREVRLIEDQTTPTWIVAPETTYLGTADDQYVTHLYGYYVASIDGTTGLPATYGIVLAQDEEMATQFGRKAYSVDLTPLGVMAEADAQDNIDGRFALIGARMGWTNGVELTGKNLRRLGFGRTTPLSMHGADGAGSMLRIPGALDSRSQPTTRPYIDIVLGQVTRFHNEDRATAIPVDFAPRDFQGALAAAERPSTGEAA